jgi:hypothetical protein
MTTSNKTFGFTETGISLFNSDTFTDYFTATFVTDRLGPNTIQKDAPEISNTSNKQSMPGQSNMDSSSGTDSPPNSHSIKEDAQFSCTNPAMLEAVRPLPKAFLTE